MSMNVSRLENVVSHYLGLLGECSESVMVIESWGLNEDKELKEVKWAQGQLLQLLAEGVEEI